MRKSPPTFRVLLDKMSQEFSREMAVSGLKEVASMFEEGGRLESSTLKIVEEFLKNFPVSVTSTRKAAVNNVMSIFPTELLQLVFSFLPLEDLKSVVMVCKRWQEVGEVMKLWEDKKAVFLEDDSMSLSSALHMVKRRGIRSIHAKSLSSDQMTTLALELREDLRLEELDIEGGALGAVNLQLFQGIFANLVKINLSNTQPTGEQLGYLFSSLIPDGKLIALALEEVDLTAAPIGAVSKVFKLVELNLNCTALNPEQINAIWAAVEQAPDSEIQMAELSVNNMNLSAVPPQALTKVAKKVNRFEASNTSLSPNQCDAIFLALLQNPHLIQIDFSDNSLSGVPPENLNRALLKTTSAVLTNSSLTSTQLEAILTAVKSGVCNTLDVSYNLLSAVDPVFLAETLMKLDSATLVHTSMTLPQVSTDLPLL